MHDVEHVLGNRAFWTALVVGALGTLVVCARARHAHPEPGVALVAVVASVVGLPVDDHLPVGLVVAMVLLAGAEWLDGVDGPLARMAASVPGALVLGAVLPDDWPFWMRATVVVVTVVGGALVADTARRVPQLTPLLLAIAAGGLYFCVPDTEAPMVLLGALLATGFVVLVPGLPPTRGFVALTGLFVWAAAYGGFARGGSVVGGIACLGVVLLGVLVARCARSTRGVVLVVLVQAALVAFVSRVAGFEQGTATAVVLALVAFVVAAGALALVAARVRVTRAPT